MVLEERPRGAAAAGVERERVGAVDGPWVRAAVAGGGRGRRGRREQREQREEQKTRGMEGKGGSGCSGGRRGRYGCATGRSLRAVCIRVVALI